MTGLNGSDDYEYEPVYRADPSPVHSTNSDMKGMVKLIDDGELEEEDDVLQDGTYDNSPNEQYLDTDFPQEGDQNNSEVAAKDELVRRGDQTITSESLMADYRAFVAEESQTKKDKRRKQMQREIDADQVRKEREREADIADLEALILHTRTELTKAEKKKGNDKVIQTLQAKIKKLEAELNIKKGEKSKFGPNKVTANESNKGGKKTSHLGLSRPPAGPRGIHSTDAAKNHPNVHGQFAGPVRHGFGKSQNNK